MVRRLYQGTSLVDQPPQSLDDIRARIDAIDAELLRLVDARAAIAVEVAQAKAAAGDGGKFALRPTREAMLVRKLIANANGAPTGLTVRLWREFISYSLAAQGPFHLAVWGGADPARAGELARLRFGSAPPLRQVAKPEDALANAKVSGGVGVLALAHGNAWWGRLLAEPKLSVFAALPCLAQWGEMSALAVAEVEVEPSGDDETFWVTDEPGPALKIVDALSRDGVAAELVSESGGLNLFFLSGFYQREDQRLARAPGRLTGVIGAAARPFDA
jgi:chorismate mutase